MTSLLVQQEVAQRKILLHLLYRTLSVAIIRWRRAVRVLLEECALQYRVLARLQYKMLSLAYSRWHDVSFKRDDREIAAAVRTATRFLKRLLNKQWAACWRSWKELIRGQRAQERGLWVIGRLLHKRKFIAFGLWLRHVAAERALKTERGLRMKGVLRLVSDVKWRVIQEPLKRGMGEINHLHRYLKHELNLNTCILF